MGFDVVVVDAISNRGFSATGIDNGDDNAESFTGTGHSLTENLNLACSHASDHKAWLTENAFEQTADIRDYTYTKCHGIVQSSYISVVRIRSHKYEYYFDEDSITTRFVVEAEISIAAPESAREGDDVVIAVTISNTGGIYAMMSSALYDGDTRVGGTTGLGGIAPGSWGMDQYTLTMPDHDWHLTAKVVSDPPVDVTKDFTITLSEDSGGNGGNGNGNGDGDGDGGNDDSCGDGCPNTCDGTSLYAQKCVDGHCVKDADAFIETNSSHCKHVELPKKDIIDQIANMLGLSKKQILYAAIIAIVIIIIGSRSS